MIKIGIITMHRINNYGSFMQAYCLKQIIKKEFNEDVSFVDYRPEKSVVDSSNDIDIYKYPSMKDTFNVKKIGLKFRILNKYLWLPKYLNVKSKNYSKYENIIIGSDEVFNCTQSSSRVGFSKELFGKGNEKSNLISYAASFGFTTIERLKKYNIYDEVMNLLKNFKSISVRDKNSASIVNELTGLTPYVNLDPVLIENLLPLAIDSCFNFKYLILYSYASRISESEANYILSFAKSKNLKIISIGSYQKCAYKNVIIDPFKVLGLFKNAEYVITDTFHGTIFSAKFHKKFVTLVRNTNSNKLNDLLNRIGLISQKVDSLSDINSVIQNDIDYNSFEKLIYSERIKAIDYLKENLKL